MPPKSKSGFDIGDEVALRGFVRLLDVGGENSVTVELHSTGQRITVMANSTSLELVAKAKGGQGYIKAPKGRQPKFILDRE